MSPHRDPRRERPGGVQLPGYGILAASLLRMSPRSAKLDHLVGELPMRKMTDDERALQELNRLLAIAASRRLALARSVGEAKRIRDGLRAQGLVLPRASGGM